MAPHQIEISYDAGAVPRGFIHAFDFNTKATALIGSWLEAAGLGRWVGANACQNPQTGRIEVSTRFVTEDADRAEALIRAAVDGTPFAAWTRFDRQPAHA